MSWRILNAQGIAGLASAAALSLLLILAKSDARHWHKQAGENERLYRGEQAAFAATVASYRAAADQARRDDAANLARISTQQSAITQRSANDFETRLASARARAGRLRPILAPQPYPGAGRSASLPDLPPSTRSAAEAPAQDRLPAALGDDDALTATEQAIQLDELIKWVRQQAQVDNNPPNTATSP